MLSHFWAHRARFPCSVLQDLLNDLFDRLSLRGPEEAEAQARVILSGLGFTQAQQEGPLGQLSGGPQETVCLCSIYTTCRQQPQGGC